MIDGRFESDRMVGVSKRNANVETKGVTSPAPIFLQVCREDIASVVKNRMGNDTARPRNSPSSQSRLAPTNTPLIEQIGTIIASGSNATNSIPINRRKSSTLSWLDNSVDATTAPMIGGVMRTASANSVAETASSPAGIRERSVVVRATTA